MAIVIKPDGRVIVDGVNIPQGRSGGISSIQRARERNYQRNAGNPNLSQYQKDVMRYGTDAATKLKNEKDRSKFITSGKKIIILNGTPLTKQRVERERVKTVNVRTAKNIRNLGRQTVLSLARRTGIKTQVRNNQIILRTSPTSSIVAKVSGGKVVAVRERSTTAKTGTSRIDVNRIQEMERRSREVKESQRIKDTPLTALEKKAITQRLILRKTPTEAALGLIQKGKKQKVLKRAKTAFFEIADKKITESEDIGQYIKQQRRLDKKLTKNETAALITAGFTIVGVRAIRGFTTPFLKPLQTIKGIGTFYSDVGRSIIRLKPTGSVDLLMNEFIRDPVGTSVEMFATIKAFQLVGKTLKPIQKTKVGKQATSYANRLSNQIKANIKGGMKSIVPIKALVRAANKLKKAAKKKTFKKAAVRKVYELYSRRKVRTTPKSRRKIELKRIKRQAKEGPTNKQLLKKIRAKKSLSLEKQRIALRKQLALEKKIASGKQIKSLKIKPTQKGYFFRDAITGVERFFTSRKQWLRAVKQQAKLTRNRAGNFKSQIRMIVRRLQGKKIKPTQKGVIGELRRIQLKKKQFKGKKSLSLEKQRIALRKQLALEKKIAQGKQVKAIKIKPTQKGYFFKDAVTGAERFFTSRKQWLRAVKQQSKTKSGINELLKNSDRFIKAMRNKRQSLESLVNNKIKIEIIKNKVNKLPKTKSKSINNKITQQKKQISKQIEQITQQGQVLILKKAKTIVKKAQKTKVTQKLVSKSKQIIIQTKKLGILNKLKTTLVMTSLIAIAVSSIRKPTTRSIRKQSPKIKLVIITKQEQKKAIKQLQNQEAKIIQKIDQEAAISSVTKQDIASLVKQAAEIKQLIKQLQKSGLKLTQKQISKITEKIKTPIKFPRIIWKTKIKKGYSPIVNVIVRIKGRNREINLRTTLNRALKYIVNKVDNTTTRSFQVKIIGIKKIKDIGKVSLKKFRPRKGTNTQVLRFVEKSKYAIDTRGEKRGLKIGKLIKKKR